MKNNAQSWHESISQRLYETAGVRPYYSDDSCLIIHGDCREILPLLEPVDLVLTDPPYNAINRASSGLRSLDKGTADSAPVDVVGTAIDLLRLEPTSVYVWCSDEQYTDWTMAFKDAGMTTRICAWWKSNPSPMNGERLWLSAMELCVYARRSGAVFNLHCQPPVWKGPVEVGIDHPTPKPEWLMRQLINASSNPGDNILDPFMGSGTTLRAAKDLGRRSIGIEISEEYCSIAVNRLQQAVLPLEITP